MCVGGCSQETGSQRRAGTPGLGGDGGRSGGASWVSTSLREGEGLMEGCGEETVRSLLCLAHGSLIVSCQCENHLAASC